MNDNEYPIMTAGFEHAQGIFELIRKHPDTLLSRSVGDIVQNIDRFLVCMHAGKVIGTVSWAILPEIGSPHNPSVEIKSLCVDKPVHGKGIGRRLVDQARVRIQPLHPVEIIVLTFTPDFFEKLGFERADKASLMHKLYTGCINCTKYDSPFTCPEVAMTFDVRERSEVKE